MPHSVGSRSDYADRLRQDRLDEQRQQDAHYEDTRTRPAEDHNFFSRPSPENLANIGMQFMRKRDILGNAALPILSQLADMLPGAHHGGAGAPARGAPGLSGILRGLLNPQTPQMHALRDSLFTGVSNVFRLMQERRQHPDYARYTNIRNIEWTARMKVLEQRADALANMRVAGAKQVSRIAER